MVYKFPATPDNTQNLTEFFFGPDAPKCSTCGKNIRYYELRQIASTKQCGECFGNDRKPYRLVEKGGLGDPCGGWTLHLVQPLVPGKRVRLHCVAYWELYFPKPKPKESAEWRPLVPFADFEQIPPRGLYVPVDDGKSLPFPFVGKVNRGLYHENGNDAQILFERKGQVYIFQAGYS